MYEIKQHYIIIKQYLKKSGAMCIQGKLNKVYINSFRQKSILKKE